MKKQSVAITQPEKEATPMKLLPASDFFDRIQDLSNSIPSWRQPYDRRTSPGPSHRV